MEKLTKKNSFFVVLSIVLMVVLFLVIVAFFLHDTGVFPSASMLGEMSEGNDYHISEDGLHYLTIEEAKNLTTEHKLTVDNWKDYFAACTEEVSYFFEDDDGNRTYKTEIEAKIDVKSPYYYKDDDVTLTLKNKVSGFTFKFKDGDWKELVEYVDGKYYVTSYDSEFNTVKMELDMDNYECLSVSGSVYEYRFTNEMVYVSVYDANSSKIVLLSEYEGNYEESNLVVLIQTGEDGTLCSVGYYSVGYFVRNAIFN